MVARGTNSDRAAGKAGGWRLALFLQPRHTGMLLFHHAFILT